MVHFKLFNCLSFAITSTDIKECKDGLHNCSQVCVELEGNFTCTCHGGYKLSEDGVSCYGMYIHLYTYVCT